MAGVAIRAQAISKLNRARSLPKFAFTAPPDVPQGGADAVPNELFDFILPPLQIKASPASVHEVSAGRIAIRPTVPASAQGLDVVACPALQFSARWGSEVRCRSFGRSSPRATLR